MRRISFAATLGFALSACCQLHTAYVDSKARDAVLTDAQKKCWELPKEQIFEAAKAAMDDYRNERIAEADPKTGRIDMFEREDVVPPGDPPRRHHLVVQLATEPTCTKVVVTAGVEVFYKKDGWVDMKEQSEGLVRDAQLKIDAALQPL